jgi:O-antigen/teichoic acid export membrane protein
MNSSTTVLAEPVVGARPPAVLLTARLDGSLWRHVSVLMMGTMAAQAIPIVTAPVLTRLFGPHEFGTYAVYNAVFGIAAIASSLHYELAITLPKRRKDAGYVYRAAGVVLAGVAVIIAGVAVASGKRLTIGLNAPALTPYLAVLVVTLVVAGTCRNRAAIATREAQFGAVARSRSIQAAAQGVGQIVAGIAGAGLGGLVTAQLVGQAAGLYPLRHAADQFKGRLTWRRIAWALKRFRQFPMYAAPSSLLTTATAQLPVIVLAYAFGPVAAGFYSLANRFLQAPAALLGQAFSQALLSAAAAARRTGRGLETVGELFESLTVLIGPVFLAMWLAAPGLCELALGSRWAEAASYARAITPWLLTTVLVTSFSILVTVTGMQSREVVFQLATAAAVAAALAAGRLSGASAVGTMAITSMAASTIGLGKLYWLLSTCGMNRAVIARHTRIVLVRLGPVSASLLVLSWLPWRYAALAAVAVTAVAWVAVVGIGMVRGEASQGSGR